jgi:hypothetical protein
MISAIWEKYGTKRISPLKKSIFQLIENKVGFQLPEDYKFFSENYPGLDNFIGEQYVSIWNVENLIEYNTDYEVFNEFKKGIGIGSNGSSEMIALKKTKENTFKIILVPYLDLDDEATHIQIGDSFINFFERLESGKEWFGKNDKI